MFGLVLCFLTTVVIFTNINGFQYFLLVLSVLGHYLSFLFFFSPVRLPLLIAPMELTLNAAMFKDVVLKPSLIRKVGDYNMIKYDPRIA